MASRAPVIFKRTGGDAGGFYIRTFTGKKFYWDTLWSNEYDIRDIAHALSMNCRWTGHTKKFYSVAQHCILASYLVPKKHALAALLHDASEAYIHDTPSPLKWYLRDKGFTAFADLEKKVDECIAMVFGVEWPRDQCVKVADLRLLATENRDLMPDGAEYAYLAKYGLCRRKIRCMSPKRAERAYLKRFKELTQ